jgi:hypothetical protein
MGGRRFCQYSTPSEEGGLLDSFCEFKEVEVPNGQYLAPEWEYSRCTCGMDAEGSQSMNIWEADLIVKFPDTHGRLVHFAIKGDQTFLFLESVCQGPLEQEISCRCFHHHDFS